MALHPGKWTMGTALPAEFGHRGLADEDCALLTRAGNRRRIMGCRRVGCELRSEAGGHAGDENVILDANWHTVDQALGRAGPPTRLGVPRASQGALAI